MQKTILELAVAMTHPNGERLGALDLTQDECSLLFLADYLDHLIDEGTLGILKCSESELASRDEAYLYACALQRMCEQ